VLLFFLASFISVVVFVFVGQPPWGGGGGGGGGGGSLARFKNGKVEDHRSQIKISFSRIMEISK